MEGSAEPCQLLVGLRGRMMFRKFRSVSSCYWGKSSNGGSLIGGESGRRWLLGDVAFVLWERDRSGDRDFGGISNPQADGRALAVKWGTNGGKSPTSVIKFAASRLESRARKCGEEGDFFLGELLISGGTAHVFILHYETGKNAVQKEDL